MTGLLFLAREYADVDGARVVDSVDLFDVDGDWTIGDPVVLVDEDGTEIEYRVVSCVEAA